MTKKKIAVLTNIIAPYRIPIFRFLAERYELAIFVAGREKNRDDWVGIERRLGAVSVKRSWGFSLRIPKLAGDGIYDYWHLHLTPGYFLDLIRFQPDAVISNEMGFRSLMALLYETLYRKPVWIWWGGTLHTERSCGLVRRALRWLVARWAKRWISYGQTSTEYLISLGIPRERILQIQNCVAEELYTRLTQPALNLQPKPVLLYVGQLIGRKGLTLLLESAARLQQEGHVFSLLLVGGGPEKGRLEMYARKLGLANVVFYPSQPPDTMPGIYRSVDCLVFPTLEDVWGLVINEALWSGISVACSVYAGSAPEIVPEENRFNPLDPADFDRVLRLAVNGRLRPADTSALLKCSEVNERIVAEINRMLGKGP